jgi:hypothetical protein
MKLKGILKHFSIQSVIKQYFELLKTHNAKWNENGFSQSAETIGRGTAGAEFYLRVYTPKTYFWYLQWQTINHCYK